MQILGCRQRRWYLSSLLILVLLILTTYQDAPLNSFHFDDQLNITGHGPVQMTEFSVAALMDAAFNGLLPYRVIPNLSFAIDWWRGGGEARVFLHTNIGLHILTSLLAFTFLLRLLQEGGCIPREPSGWQLASVLLATLIWSLHPIQSQAVAYVVQRMSLFATFFSLASLTCYLNLRTSKLPWRRKLWLAGCLFAALAAFISKENTWVLPFLLVLLEYGVCRNCRPLMFRQRDKLLGSVLGLLVILLILDIGSGRGPLSGWIMPGYAFRDFTLQERLLTQPRVILFHFSQWLWPLPGRFSVEHAFAVSRSLTDPWTTALALALALTWVVAGLGLLLLQGRRIWGVALLWLPITLAVESSLVPLEIVFEHRFYLPSVGLVLLIGLTLLQIHSKAARVAAVSAGVAVVLLLSVATYFRVPVWSSERTLYQDAVQHAPGSSRAWGNLSFGYYQEGELKNALRAAKKALDLDKRNLNALESMGVLLLDLGRLEQASGYLQRALWLSQPAPPASLLNHLGELALQETSYALALDYFNQAIAIEPWNSVYYWNLALTYEARNECDLAYSSWQKFLSMANKAADLKAATKHLAQNAPGEANRCNGPLSE